MAKKILKCAGVVIAVIILAALLFILYLTVTEFRPADKEAATEITRSADNTVKAGDSVSILSWNIGYAGLGVGSDFFMDGGDDVASADKATVSKYLKGIDKTAYNKENKADITLFQEVDQDSSRSYHIDERKTLARGDSFLRRITPVHSFRIRSLR